MKKICLNEIERYTFGKETYQIEAAAIGSVEKSFQFLNDFATDKIIYGINTGFGPMAQYRIESEELQNLQYNLIRSHSSGMGEPLTETYARSVVLARLNSFLQGNSGISPEVPKKLVEFLNADIIPEILEHGSVGASGDLVQLAQLGLNLIGEGYVYVDGQRKSAADVLEEKNIEPLQLQLRDGLGLINGTSCMTGLAAVNLIYAKRLFSWAVAASAMINELLESFDDSFSHELNAVKHHKGQQEVAKQMRTFLADSGLIRKRDDLYNDVDALCEKEFKKKIQEYYSIRCVPQILGPVVDTLNYAIDVVEAELNSTNDNPIVNLDIENVFHGGNFHGDYISLEMDKVKIVITKMTMLMERQLNFLMNRKLNDKFPPFLNAGTLGLNFGYQGMQFTATSTTAESQTLSNPMYVHSIPNNNDNQDIVSMGTNSALLTKKVIENGFQVMAIHVMAICQAIDLLPEGECQQLSMNSKRVYDLVRENADFITTDTPRMAEMQIVCALLSNQEFKI